jgi:hypothetical protein
MPRRSILLFTVLVLFTAAGATAAETQDMPKAEAEDGKVKEVWDGVRGDLSKIVDRIGRHASLPKSRWWREDQTSNREKINGLMEDALSTLEITTLSEYRRKYSELEEAIKSDTKLIGTYIEEKVGAPEESGVVSQLWETTKAEYEKKIERLEEDVAASRRRQGELVEKMQAEMARMGIKVTKDQVSSLLLVVSGDSFLDISSSFHNVKQLTVILGKLIQENEKYVQNSRKYYGMYVALVGILIHAHERAAADINEKYLPQIDEILTKTKRAGKHTRELMKENAADAAVLKRLKRNLEAQTTVSTAGAAYREHLQGQLVKLKEAAAALQKHYEVALNTFETVDVAASMLNVIKNSADDFEALQSMQLPAMLPLETERIREQFQAISDRLRND